jgi:hypothetical protein
VVFVETSADPLETGHARNRHRPSNQFNRATALQAGLRLPDVGRGAAVLLPRALAPGGPADLPERTLRVLGVRLRRHGRHDAIFPEGFGRGRAGKAQPAIKGKE